MIRPLLMLTLFFATLFPGVLSRKHCTSDTYADNSLWLGQQQFKRFNPQLKQPFSEDVETITIPLKRAGNLILLEALIDSIRGNLILDTGAKGIVLNSIYFRQQNRSGNMMAGGITGSASSLGRITIPKLQISEVTFSGVQADISDLGHIEQARNTKILGFVGLDLLSEFEVVLDLKNSVMELHRLDYYGNRVNSQPQQPEYDLDLGVRTAQDVMFIDANISGRKLTFCLDTGAEANVISSHLPNRVLNTISIFRRSSLKGVGSQSVEVLYGIMNDFSIAGNQITGMHTIITNLSAMSNSYGVRIDGMLGCDFFEKGIICMNLKKKNLRIRFYKEDLQ